MKTKFIIIFIAVLVIFMGCKKLSVPTEVIMAEPTLTQLPAAQTTQTAVALQTAGVTAQQTATAQAQM
ncbi:MAG TPA: hypothetical protein PKJ42_07205, partial [Candidatus Goldiibacteriota bacterium]|nr:hypothetical protein [Candidatus Goldiibacteriota bacterium]